MLRWGLVPFWAKDVSIGNRMINARAETVATKPAFRRGFKRHRCVILADGFYEWQHSEKGKVPFYVSARDGSPFAMAGLWETWNGGDGSLETCAIITTEANRLMEPLHPRMPVVLTAETVNEWIDFSHDTAEALLRLLKPCDEKFLQVKKVSRAVNNPSNEGPELLQSG